MAKGRKLQDGFRKWHHRSYGSCYSQSFEEFVEFYYFRTLLSKFFNLIPSKLFKRVLGHQFCQFQFLKRVLLTFSKNFLLPSKECMDHFLCNCIQSHYRIQNSLTLFYFSWGKLPWSLHWDCKDKNYKITTLEILVRTKYFLYLSQSFLNLNLIFICDESYN